ncbi:hypothetical protein [Enterococcus gilvus]|uniref:Uncharacterized protein n=1 Tax=Enterococcus gilvus ATCC BAA-350 TaxID=1158614 RepID=R2XT03_9ENTE|nr:hypothetical protein [Enterococcus gilvus]EOI53107.1 hypothetical protein UKC_04015 [Enterococcus gilvus ATCC BAA-350]EOW78426.1 hypothetical protein I592_04019 [Enterococcus gilvus ATCC BAA-350]
MNESSYQSEKKEETEVAEVTYATTFKNHKPYVQGAIFALWRIHHKKFQAGSQLFYEEIRQHVSLSKTAYKEALAFLEGAGMVVNEVVITDKVPQALVERYGIL